LHDYPKFTLRINANWHNIAANHTSLPQGFRLKYQVQQLNMGFKMDEILEFIGPGPSALLSSSYGGCVIVVPTKRDTSNDASVFYGIARIIGREAAELMIERAAGELIYIPMLFAAKLQERNEAIFNERENGARCRALALKYRMSERNIHACIERHKKRLEQR
jgi:hypothetical protein